MITQVKRVVFDSFELLKSMKVIVFYVGPGKNALNLLNSFLYENNY